MKVPLYTAQTQRQSGAITPQVSQQLSAQTLNAGAAIEARKAYGSLLREGGQQLIQIHAESQANKGLKAYNAEVRAIENAAISGDFSTTTPGEVMQKLEAVYNEYASGKKINPETNKPFFTTGLARRLFNKDADSTYQSTINNYRKEMIKQVQAAAQVNVVDRINQTVASVVDTSKDVNERFEALSSLYNPGIYNESTQEWMVPPGVLVNSPGSPSFGRFTSEKFLALQEGTVKKVLEGTMINKMRSQDPLEVVNSLADGAMFDPNSPAHDPIMAAAFDQLDADERKAFISGQITFAENQIRIDEAIRKRTDEAADKLLKDEHITMLNLAAAGDDASMQQAMAIHQKLIRQNFYEDTTSINADKKLLGLTSKEAKKEDDIDAIEVLRTADMNNTLTPDLVRAHQNSLTSSSYDKYWKAAIAEQDEGTRNAKSLMMNAIGYSEDKVDLTTRTGRTLSKKYRSVLDEYYRWLETDADPGQPLSGGRGSSYDIRVQKARQLSDKAIGELKGEIQQNFDQEVSTSIVSYFKMIPPLRGTQIPQKGTVPNRVDWILDALQGIPAAQRTAAINSQILALTQMLKPYIGEDVQ